MSKTTQSGEQKRPGEINLVAVWGQDHQEGDACICLSNSLPNVYLDLTAARRLHDWLGRYIAWREGEGE